MTMSRSGARQIDKVNTPRSTESGSTTLRSVIQRMSPSMVAKKSEQTQALQPELSFRKTPFGVVRIPSGTHKRIHTTHAGRNAVDSDMSVARQGKPLESRQQSDEDVTLVSATHTTQRLLPPSRQRTRHGRAELLRDGTLCFAHTQLGIRITIAPDLKHAAILGIDGLATHKDVHNVASQAFLTPVKQLSSLGITLYEMAIAWLMRYRRKIIIAIVLLSNGVEQMEQGGKRQSRGMEYMPICSIYANGPRPDYQVRFSHHQQSNVVVDVHISRMLGKARIVAQIGAQDVADRKINTAWSYHQVDLPLDLIESKEARTHVDVLLNTNEQMALKKSLAVAEQVDSIYRNWYLM